MPWAKVAFTIVRVIPSSDSYVMYCTPVGWVWNKVAPVSGRYRSGINMYGTRAGKEHRGSI